jgi:hypothetical protein
MMTAKHQIQNTGIARGIIDRVRGVGVRLRSGSVITPNIYGPFSPLLLELTTRTLL